MFLGVFKKRVVALLVEAKGRLLFCMFDSMLSSCLMHVRVDSELINNLFKVFIFSQSRRASNRNILTNLRSPFMWTAAVKAG